MKPENYSVIFVSGKVFDVCALSVEDAIILSKAAQISAGNDIRVLGVYVWTNCEWRSVPLPQMLEI